MGNYRGISLLSIPSKVLSIILGQRMKFWVDEKLLATQYGFRPERGCMDAIFGLRRLQEEATTVGIPLYACFVDLSIAYDSIDRSLAWKIFEARGMPKKLLDLIRDSHTHSLCALKGDHRKAESWFEVKTGFKQGDVNSPMLFNLFLDTVLRACQPELECTGVRFHYNPDELLRGKTKFYEPGTAWALAFADDALVANTAEDLQQAMQVLDRTFARWGLEISLKKTKVVPLAGDPAVTLTLDRGLVETVTEFKYLGILMTGAPNPASEIKQRIAKAGHAFHSLGKIWDQQHLALWVKCSIYKTVVQATLLYGCEAWAAKKEDLDHLDVFQMRCLRRMCKISLRDKIPNVATLKKCDIDKVADMVRFRRLRWLGHTARMDKDRLPRQFLSFSLPQGVRRVGRPIKGWTDYVCEDLSSLGSLYDWKKVVPDRDEWRKRIYRLLVHI